MKFSHICPHEDGGDRGGVWGRTFCPPLFAVPGPPHSPRTRTDRMAHGLTRTDSRDAPAAHQVRQDPNGVNRARIAPATQATGEWQYSVLPRAGSQVRSVSPRHGERRKVNMNGHDAQYSSYARGS